ncbi:MAG: hypothetical protein BGN96_07120 [Bacteroidales bacterium 45-6]|nr:MAG: hypothetical protein BGN96_07120 [Bacteroidales bacterium 45-6]
MKRIQFIGVLFCLLIAFSSCNNDENSRLTTQASVINDLETTDFILPDAASGQNMYLFRLNWTKTKFFTDFGSPVFVSDINYTVEADLAESDFSNPVVVGTTKGLYVDIYTETLRSLLMSLAGENNSDSQTISLRIKATGNAQAIISEPILLTVSPYALSGLTVVPGAINTLSASNYTLQNPGTQNPVLFEANWAETSFFLHGGSTSTTASSVDYTLQIDRAGNDFKSAQVLAETTSLSADIYTKDFNQLLMDKFGANSSESIDLQMRVLIKYTYKGATGNALSANVISFKATPYTTADPLQPMYIFGDFNNWDNSNTATMLIMFKDNQGTDNYSYTYTGYMPMGNYKFLPKESLGTNKTYCFKEAGKLQYTEISGNAFYNATAGYKTITINVQDLTCSVSDYDISGNTDWSRIGLVGIFNGWTDTDMTRLSDKNRHIWILDLTLPALAAGNTHPVKFRANGSWDYRWAPAEPENAMYGKTIFKKSPDDNIVIRAGGNYHVVFNDLTGHYIFLLK